jgi:predicted metalloprotease with PDZ domain
MKRKTYLMTTTILAFMVAGIYCQSTVFSQSNKSNLPQSKLGVKGEMGFVITTIDANSPLGQAGLKPGDIITGLNGQVTSIEKFQQDIATSSPGTAFDVTYLRFNFVTSKLEEQKTRVKTIPFATETRKKPRIIPAMSEKGFSFQGCSGGCCNTCEYLVPGDQECILVTYLLENHPVE